MENEIQILSDAIANRIAAGEVVSRPSAAVKELLENSIDAGADYIRLVFKDGGKSLIMVQDNGKGMNESDARMCFERHATSKIKNPDDIFHITTKGFRGEALASIAAIAKVELKTRRAEVEVGTMVRMEGSEFIAQEECSMSSGTVITIKSLFYNVPARRKFLKNDYTEAKHIIDEFERVALAHPGLKFEMVNNDQLVHKLEAGNLRQRIVDLYGASYKERLVPISETTDVVSIEGFVVKPEFARKTAGEQFFFANNRFIRSPFLKHAVDSAYEGMLQKDMRPGFFIFLEVNPSEIDINIHPQKVEVKFSDERIIYHILQSAVKNALGKFNIVPSMDFERDVAFDIPFQKPLSELTPPSIEFNPNYNPFTQETGTKSSGGSYSSGRPSKDDMVSRAMANWQDAHKQSSFDEFEQTEVNFNQGAFQIKSPSFQWLNQYIVTTLKSGLVIIDQQRAHFRVVYEDLKNRISLHQVATQQEMFPYVIEFKAADYEAVKELLETWKKFGFDIEDTQAGSLIIKGIPAGAEISNLEGMFEEMIENWKHEGEHDGAFMDSMLQKLAKRMAMKRGVWMSEAEMEKLLADLFSTQNPNYSPDGKTIISTIGREEIVSRLGE